MKRLLDLTMQTIANGMKWNEKEKEKLESLIEPIIYHLVDV